MAKDLAIFRNEFYQLKALVLLPKNKHHPITD
jgi:hypothetical protein